jgi:hypothetical protein
LNENFQSGNENNMGQRDGFAASDLQKLNKMYRCSNVPSQPSAPSGPSSGGNRPQRPTYQKPNRPGITGGSQSGGSNGGFTNPVANFISGVGNFFQALGGKHDETDDFESTNILDEN